MSNSTKSLRPFFCYFGGKWRLAPKYPSPLFPTIVEPFAGAAGYSTRHYSRRVILVDADPVIAGLWRYLISADPKRILSLPDIEDDATVDDYDELCQEEKWLIGFWLKKGAAIPCKSPSSWMRTGDSLFWGGSVRQRIAQQVPYIRHWKIFRDWYDAVPNIRATWFIDPPYQIAGVAYRYGNDLNYSRLAKWCRSRKGQVIVCEAEGAKWLPFRPFATSRSSNGKSKEIIWSKRVE